MEPIEINLRKYKSSKFPFQKCLTFLESAGKPEFGDHFIIHEEDHETIFKMFVNFFHDKENGKELNYRL